MQAAPASSSSRECRTFLHTVCICLRGPQFVSSVVWNLAGSAECECLSVCVCVYVCTATPRLPGFRGFREAGGLGESKEHRTSLLLRHGPSREVRHRCRRRRCRRWARNIVRTGTGNVKRESDEGLREGRWNRRVGQFIPGRRESSGEGSGSSVMSSCADQRSELPPLVSWFRPHLRLSVLRGSSTSLSFQSSVSLPEHVPQKRPRCVLDAPLQSATLEIPAESIFGDLDSGFFPACVDRGAPEQEIRRTHAHKRTANFSMQQKARTRRRRGFGLRGSEQELETIYFQLQITHGRDKTQPEVIKSTEKKKKKNAFRCFLSSAVEKEWKVCSRVMLT